MRAAVLRSGGLQVGTTADPAPGPGQVLVRTRMCGICASDLHTIEHGEILATDPSGCFAYDTSRDLVLGHEYCAETVDHGPETVRTLAVGTRVTSSPVVVTPAGPRAVGLCNEYPGGFGELMVLDEALLHRVDDGLPDEHAALVEPLSTGAFYVRRSAISGEEVPVVIGCGAIGLAVITSLRRAGVRPIVAADFSVLRRDLAVAMGADVCEERWDAEAERFWVARVSANTWRWIRTPDGWRIAARVNANLDGTPEHREMLAPRSPDPG